MLYKSKYCSECASKLDDFVENIWSQTKYCEICKPDYRKIELVSRFGGVVFGVIATIFGVGTMLKTPIEKPLNIIKPEIAAIASVPKQVQKTEINQQNIAVQQKQVEANKQVALSSKQVETQLPKQSTEKASDKKTQQNVAEVSQSLATESVYICGVKTKKGLPCSRKVKGSVRCWQHVGQEPMLPQKNLRIE